MTSRRVTRRPKAGSTSSRAVPRASCPSCRATPSAWRLSGARRRPWSVEPTIASSPADVVAAVPSVGGTKNPRVEDIVRLEPDLVLANQEENTRGDLEALAQRGVRVYVSFPKRVADGLSPTPRPARAPLRRRALSGRAPAAQARLRRAPRRGAGARRRPGRAHVLSDLDGPADDHSRRHLHQRHARPLRSVERLRRSRAALPLAADLGKASPFPPEKVADRDVRYPRVTLEEVVARAPELVLLPDEPHPFSEEDAQVFRSLAIPGRPREAPSSR